MNVDLVVVGSGDAAQGVVHRMRAAGWSVAAIDSRPFGGTCSLRGCDPKKVLVGLSELADWGRRMQGSGISAPTPTLAWSDMIAFKRTIIEHVPTDVENGFREAGITALHGRAHFVGPKTLAVGDQTITSGHVLIAGAARHAPLGIPGEEHLTHEHGLSGTRPVAAPGGLCRRRIYRLRVRPHRRPRRRRGHDPPPRRAAARSVRRRPGGPARRDHP